MESSKLKLDDVLVHLEQTNRKAPLISFGGVWLIEEAEYFLEEVTEKDHRSFHTVAIALNEGELNAEAFLKLNAQREVRLKESVVNHFRSVMNKGGEIILTEDNIVSMARHYMNEHVVPKIQNKSDDTFFLCVGEDLKKGYYVSILDSKQIKKERAVTLFQNRESKNRETLVKVFIDFDLMEYHATILKDIK